MKEVSEFGRLVILLSNVFRKKKIRLEKRPMYMILDDRWYSEDAAIYLNHANLTEEEVEKLGLHPNGRKWLVTN